MALRNKVASLVMVQWQHRKVSKWTWEPEEDIREHYADLFAIEDFEGKSNSSGGGEIVTFMFHVLIFKS